MKKFQRNFQLIVQVDEAGGTITITDPLTIEFYVSHKAMAAVNSSNFTILNLGLQKRLQIQKDRYSEKKYRSVEFRAGYGGTYTTIFKGNIQMAQSGKREGATEIFTEIEAFDGGYAMINSRTGNISGTNRAYGAGTPRSTVIKDLCSDLLGVGVGAIATESFPGQCLRGRSLNGPTQDLLKRETNNHFFIYNEKVYCLTNNDVIQGGIKLISSSTGLLGTPRRQGALLLVDILFEPGLTLGQVVDLESVVNPVYNGTYKVMGLEHRGVISAAVGGKCMTTVSLWAGTKKFQLVAQGLRNGI